jgi:peptidoglycan/xylan/chitin deacetylase (PgdA/CDA1 family)
MISVPIFVYHHITETPGPSTKYKYQITSDLFERQMIFLFQKGFRCLSLSEVVANWQEGKPQPKHSFVLTFDDGYIDNFENASPILKKFGFTATIFVVVKPVEDSISGYLSWQKMRELDQHPFSFGSHTLTHPSLPKLDNHTIERELGESKKIIEDRLGKAVEMFAYPYGESNERIRDLASQAGYRAAFGVNTGKFGLFNLWRVPVFENESDMSFYWKSRGIYNTYTWLREETYFGGKIRAFRRLLRGEPA